VVQADACALKRGRQWNACTTNRNAEQESGQASKVDAEY